MNWPVIVPSPPTENEVRLPIGSPSCVPMTRLELVLAKAVVPLKLRLMFSGLCAPLPVRSMEICVPVVESSVPPLLKVNVPLPTIGAVSAEIVRAGGVESPDGAAGGRWCSRERL